MSTSQRRKIATDTDLDFVEVHPQSHEPEVAWRHEIPKQGDIPDVDWRQLQHEVARYVASMTTELATMARSARFDLLVYFLEMAHTEAIAQGELTEG